MHEREVGGNGRRRERLDVYLHASPSLVGLLGQLAAKLDCILKGQMTMSAEMDRLQASVARNTTVGQSVITLVKGLAQQIRDNVNDPAKLTALANEIDKDSTDLEAAVSENTPPVEPPVA